MTVARSQLVDVGVTRYYKESGTHSPTHVESAVTKYTSGIRPVCLYMPTGFGHVRGMATLSSNSTDAEVWAAYDDNASYEEDGSRTKALAFVTACRILRRRLPLSAGRGPQTVTRESLDAEIATARAWLDGSRKGGQDPFAVTAQRVLCTKEVLTPFREQGCPFDGPKRNTYGAPVSA